MEELTKQCLALSNKQKMKLISMLRNSLVKKDAKKRFDLLHKAANDILGKEVLMRKRDFDLVLGRKVLAYRMRQEGFSYWTIARCLQRDHSTVVYMVKVFKEALELKFKEDTALLQAFELKVKEYEKEIPTEVV